MGLSGADSQIILKNTSVPVNRLQTIMQSLGHTHIDILKMDIEGHEWPFFHDILMRDEPFVPFDQLSVEFHNASPGRLAAFGRVMAKLEQAGLFSFQREPNPFYPCYCVEYSFARFAADSSACVSAV